MNTPDLALHAPLTTVELALYAVGWLVWTPTYVVALLKMFRPKGADRTFVIPTVAVCGNVAFEGLWFVVGDFTHASLIRWVYLGAFLLDVPILVGVTLYGAFGAPLHFGLDDEIDERLKRGERQQHYAVVAFVLVAWLAIFGALRWSYEVPLGSVGAYLDNLVMSALFVWLAWLISDTPVSKWVAWSKFLGTFFVTVMVALHYTAKTYSFLYVLAVFSGVLDVWLLWMVYHPLLGPPPPHTKFLASAS